MEIKSPGAHDAREYTPMECLPVKEMAQLYYPAFSEAIFRNLIVRAEATAKHPELAGSAAGFIDVIVRFKGQRKVLLDRLAFDRWLASGRHIVTVDRSKSGRQITEQAGAHHAA
jgi:hypothetical protein